MMLQTRDMRHIWHPCTQMKDHETIPLLEVTSASGCYLHLSDGRKIIDAVSSWWCKSLGHQHPRIKQAVQEQLEKFEHVIFAGTTNEVIVRLSELLAQLMPPLDKVLYAGDGSCAVEMALKLSLHAQHLRGEHQRTKFISLQNAYHGETAGAMSVSDLGIYRAHYQSILFDVVNIPVPYVKDLYDPLWDDCSLYWGRVESILNAAAEKTAAIIVEPIMQGAAGMRMYSKDFLKQLRQWTEKNKIYLIADEIMTGMCRTGKMLACEHAEIIPDFLCLSKGLTSGWLPLSVTLTRQEIYDLCYDDYAAGKSFLHSHTYSGNVLAASAAVAVINIMRDDDIANRANILGEKMRTMMNDIANETGLLRDVRGMGAIAAADVISNRERPGIAVYEAAIKRGALLRPLGDTLYWLPPLIMSDVELSLLTEITRDALITLI
ncbi:MAG TPA: adenosylmethionine--8-amino-7-oxononanoate transaminase [Gammaproteobacteria bacterium]|nr:adenosylmethionine--8-amino-7-oxononanoate transaminase [Gammaproteobacteria bacterium]